MRNYTILTYALLLICFFALKYYSVDNKDAVLRTNDSRVFLDDSRYPLVSSRIFAGGRSPTPLLLFKAANADPVLVSGFYKIFSVVAWFSLGVLLAREVAWFPLKLATVIAVGLYSLSIAINQWDRILMAEALSFSLFALTIGCTIALSAFMVKDNRRVTGRFLLIAAIWSLVCLAFTLARDSNMYVIATLAVVFLLWLGVDLLLKLRQSNQVITRDKIHVPLAICVVVLIGCFVINDVSLRNSVRWRTPLLNVILERILPNPDVYAFWKAEYGFPQNADFEQYVGLRAWSALKDGEDPLRARLNTDPELHDIESWLGDKGISSYSRFLVRDYWRESVATSIEVLPQYVNNYEKRLTEDLEIASWAKVLDKYVYPEVPRPFSTLLIVTGIVCLAMILFPSSRLLGVAAVFLMLNAWAQMFVTYHGDADGILRHAGLVGIIYRLGILTACLAVLNGVVQAIRGRSRQTEASVLVSPNNTTA